MAEYISYQPNENFNVSKWSGNDTARSITGVGYQPDYTWVKDMTGDGYNGTMYDSVRGAGADKELIVDNDNAEGAGNSATYGYVSAFVSDGFSLGEGSSNDDYVNKTGHDYVCWNFRAGTTSGITTDGSTTITPTGYSFNSTSGFSIIQYGGNSTSGAGFPHGLGVAPTAVIVKKTSGADRWCVYHKSLGNTKYLQLNQNDGPATESAMWNNTSPTATNVILGNSDYCNDTGATYIAYCFTDKLGGQKFGSYVGNGNTDGSFIVTGFRPAMVIIKRADASAQNWVQIDDRRPGYQYNNAALFPNSNTNEDSGAYMNLFSNGFKVIDNDNIINGGGDDYIYLAFARYPIVSSNDVPTVAR